MKNNNRRYDIDWVRVIAIGLLLVYHTAIGFQPWGVFIGFITSNPPWPELWTPMTLLNVWRIPLLFYVSGMGVFLAIQNRNWKQLFKERFKRIGIPLLFGIIAIVPLHILLTQKYYHQPFSYVPNMGHLWFLGNILVYVVLLSPLLYFLKSIQSKTIGSIIIKWLNTPLFLLLLLLSMELEAVWLHPSPFELYAFTLHGFVLGLLAFLFGFLMMYAGNTFWIKLSKWRWLFLLLSAMLFILRLQQAIIPYPVYLQSAESNVWIFTLLGFAYKFLNKPSAVLNYLREAAYPVYIVHMIFLYLGSLLIFPLPLAVSFKYILLLLFTVIGCLSFYEFVIRRVNVIRVLFGLKWLETLKSN